MIYILIYIIGAVITYGINFAVWQNGYPEWLAKEDYKKDIMNSISMAAIWPLSIIALTLCHFTGGPSFNGIKFK